MTILRADREAAKKLVVVVSDWMDKCCKGARGRTLFTVEAKKDIIHCVRELGISFHVAGNLLDEAGLQGEWKGNLRRWSIQEDEGRLNIQNAVSVRTTKPAVVVGKHLNPFHEVLAALIVEQRRTPAEVESMFAVALGRVKDDLTKAALESMDVILKSKGLTLDDLKKAL